MNYFIGLDNGGTVIKACVFDENGKQISIDKQKVSLMIPADGYTERDLLTVWQANYTAIKNAVSASGVDKNHIKSIGISGHGKGLYLLDKAGKELYNGIVSTDTRAIEIRQFYEKNGVSEKIYEQNCQKILESQPVCLLRWLKENDPEIYSQIGYVLSVKDYIRYKLTGKIYAEYTDISGSNLINLKTGKKDREQLKLFGVEEMYDCIPEIRNSFENCGTLTVGCAELVGLSTDVIVCGGMFDIDACALSVGITDDRDICVIAGTWSINEYISKTPVTASRSMNSMYCLEGYYLVEECSPTSAGNFEWFMNEFMDGKNYDEVSAEIDKINPEDSNVLFLPFLFASNEDNPYLKGTFAEITPKTHKNELARAVFEGIVFAHKRHIDKLLEARETPRAVRLTGGAANSEVWAQMFADILELRVETVADREHGCFGAGLAGAVCAGIFPDIGSAMQNTVKVGKVFEPDLQKSGVYRAKFDRYKRLISAVSEYYGM